MMCEHNLELCITLRDGLLHKLQAALMLKVEGVGRKTVAVVIDSVKVVH